MCFSLDSNQVGRQEKGHSLACIRQRFVAAFFPPSIGSEYAGHFPLPPPRAAARRQSPRRHTDTNGKRERKEERKGTTSNNNNNFFPLSLSFKLRLFLSVVIGRQANLIGYLKFASGQPEHTDQIHTSTSSATRKDVIEITTLMFNPKYPS